MEDRKENALNRLCNKLLNKKAKVDKVETTDKEDTVEEGFLLNSRPIDDGECYKGYKKIDK